MDDLKQVLRADYSMYLEDENMNIDSLLDAADRIERLEAALRKADEWFDNMETFDSADEGLSIIKLDAAAYQRMEAVGDALRRALDGEDE